MRLEGESESRNVIDRRGQRVGRGPVMLGGGVGTLVILGLVWLLGGNPLRVLEQINQNPPVQDAGPRAPNPREDELKIFVSKILQTTERVWHEEFRKINRTYEEPKLVIFTDQVESACGIAGAATGPFYCPRDQQVYIDLSFYDELDRKFGAPGDFAQAYVIAHEVGHHVQNLLGRSDEIQSQRGRVSQEEYNRLSVRLELHADFLAGVWAHHARRNLERGDIEEGLRAANAIGDDRLQKQAQGRVVPDSFTHGTSEQRMRWFMKGFQSGRLEDGEELYKLRYESL
jgi:predicted metalloprotease